MEVSEAMEDLTTLRWRCWLGEVDEGWCDDG